MVRRARRGSLAALVGVAALAVACSADSGDAGGAAGTTGTSAAVAGTAPAAPVAVEAFTGDVAAFYRVPDPLPPGEPGDLIRTMAIDAPAGEAGLRIMYHSTDAEGDDRAVTGVVYHPTGDAPDGGWPIVAWTHGTSGLAAGCAESRKPVAPPGFGVTGVRVASDYIGLGPDGELHPYLSGAAEGNATIDAVAAARTLPDAHAGDEWVVAGVSQGGHAALFTNQLAADRLPEARLLGAVAIAPGSQLGETYGDDLQARIITTMVLAGVAAEDPDVDLADYLSPDALAAASVIEDGCVADIIDGLLPLAASPDYFVTDPRTSPVGEAWIEQNDPGQVASDSPVFLVQGGQDIVVLPARTAALFERLCSVGQVVETLDVPAADHNTVTNQASEQIAAWIAARFVGDPPVDDC